MDSEVYFLKSDKAMDVYERKIKEAKTSLDVCMYYASNETLCNLIGGIELEKKVKVRVLVGTCDDAKRDKLKFINKSVIRQVPEYIHYAFVIIDGKEVLFGSVHHTWHSFDGNAENFVVHKDPETIKCFQDVFDRHYNSIVQVEVNVAEAEPADEDEVKQEPKIENGTNSETENGHHSETNGSNLEAEVIPDCKTENDSNIKVESVEELNDENGSNSNVDKGSNSGDGDSHDSDVEDYEEPTPSNIILFPRKKSMEKYFDEIKSATKTLDVCIYWFKSLDMFKILKELKDKNVEIRIVTSNRSTWENRWKNKIAPLVDQGFVVKAVDLGIAPPPYQPLGYSMHNKFCIIDGKKVLSGSLNWTDGAFTSNHDIVMIYEEPKVVQDFQDKFTELFKLGELLIPFDALPSPVKDLEPAVAASPIKDQEPVVTASPIKDQEPVVAASSLKRKSTETDPNTTPTKVQR